MFSIYSGASLSIYLLGTFRIPTITLSISRMNHFRFLPSGYVSNQAAIFLHLILCEASSSVTLAVLTSVFSSSLHLFFGLHHYHLLDKEKWEIEFLSLRKKHIFKSNISRDFFFSCYSFSRPRSGREDSTGYISPCSSSPKPPGFTRSRILSVLPRYWLQR